MRSRQRQVPNPEAQIPRLVRLGIWVLGFGMWDVAFPSLIALGAPPQGTPNPYLQFIPFLLILAIFYFIIVRPMKKRQQKVQEFLGALKINDRVITSGGIFGTITRLNDQSVQLQGARGISQDTPLAMS